MIKVNLFMKSGNIIKFKCEEIEIKRNGLGTLTGYSITHGESMHRLMDVEISAIEGITIEDEE